ncbi:MAG TPA: GNAT family N-acetyltransferase [Thermoanaerobaculia bacterium]
MPTVRPAEPSDRTQLAALRHALWPDCPLDEEPVDPAFVAVGEDGALVGFVEVRLRSHAEDCESSPVGYLEGWYVVEQLRRSGIGAQLVRAAEDWARAQGCTEMASDTWLDNTVSHRAHEALGYEEVERLVHYRKALRGS